MTVLDVNLHGWVLIVHVVYGILCWCTGSGSAILLFFKPAGETQRQRIRKVLGTLALVIFVFAIPANLLGQYLIDAGYEDTALMFVAVAGGIGFVMGIGAAKHYK